MHELTIIQQNGGSYIDSREVAATIGKPHNDLMKSIRKYCGHLTAGYFPLSDFFLESTYFDSTGRELPCFLLSKLGCEMVANKLTGEKGVLFTAAYVTEFNAMEKTELERLANERSELEDEIALLSAMPAPRLGEFNACSRIVVRALRDMGATAEQVIKFLKGVYEPLGIAIAEDSEFGDMPQLYAAKQIAKRLGMYSTNGNPHNQAVSCILNEIILISENHKSVITQYFGTHAGVSIRYDEYAAQAVEDWLCAYHYPNEIYGFDRTYRVLYKD